ncbi:hypothetical protein [Acidisphaera sp. S103]|uniref:hypothetical protein n=1 Tax=Acidisphaera sp. S103 TaxID=1747223 RepID=UPI00131E00F1|nr:hypothetical protein [Acidisphaera sp. S103]
MRRILLACIASLIVYISAFACLLDRPLTLGALRTRIEATVALARTIHQPKLVILAGSNGPYSHRCEIIGPIVGRPCINAGVAVGIGLDYLFTRWKPLLHAGDIVYLPMEETQYARPRATSDLGPDASIMLRYDRATLRTLPLRRQVAALFAGDLRAAIMSLIETVLVEGGFHDPRVAVDGGFNVWGDHIGHTAALAAVNRSTLAVIVPVHHTAAEVRDGYGAVEITEFLRWTRRHGVRAVGGLPTGFIDSPIAADSIAAIRTIYRDQGADFLELPNHSDYPRTDFFDTQDHLNEEAQIAHSKAIGEALVPLMDREWARSR